MKSVAKNIFIKLILAVGFIVIAAMFSDSYAASGEIDCKKHDKTDEKGVDKNSQLKTFTRKYWEMIEQRVPNFPEDLRIRGIVLGDMHFANLGLYYDHKNRRTHLLVNDLDDSGTNFVIGDLLKFLIYLKTIKEIDFKNGDVVDAYIDGLAGKPIEDYPAGLLKKMEVKEEKALKNYIDYLNNKRKDGEKFADEKVSKENAFRMAQLETEQLSPLSLKPGIKWVYQEDSGSSKGMNRFLFFVNSKNDSNSAKALLEFKQMKCSATNSEKSQNLGKNYIKVSEYMKKTLGFSVDSFMNAQAVVLISDQYYLRRFKAPNLINDLEITKQSQTVQQEYAEFFARYLGSIHSAEVDKTYIQAVTTRKSFLLEQAKDISKEFFNRKSKL